MFGLNDYVPATPLSRVETAEEIQEAVLKQKRGNIMRGLKGEGHEGSFSGSALTDKSLNRLITELEEAGYSVRADKSYSSSSTTFYKVQIAPAVRVGK